MPYLLDTEDRVSVLARACDRLLAEEGPGALSLRAISRVSGVSTSSMIHHLDTRERLLRVCAHVSTKARLRVMTDDVIDTGPTAVLPVDALGLEDVRSWLGWMEVWRTMPSLGQSLAPARDGEVSVVARALDHSLPRGSAREVQALVDGLRVALCLPGSDLEPAEARQHLAAGLGRLTGLAVSATEPLVRRDAWGWPFVPQPRAVARSRMPT
ncbi:TetR family transcriptional regulator C-terminal domain-containing protein [Nocardioides aurantiacus]|uniref:TetR family transcriptional regulator C-terminal domain-containing protein n=1 Tax=Nocardioides aurantiacus TaxID=86796 RepID=UPI00403F8207